VISYVLLEKGWLRQTAVLIYYTPATCDTCKLRVRSVISWQLA
jgi:hypothetical protein